MSSFTEAAKAYGATIARVAKVEMSANQAVCQLYAIGFLSHMTRKEINTSGREASGLTVDEWATDKTRFSKAHRAIAGEYGLREWLAVQWAKADFSVSLETAYEMSAAPRSEKDAIEEVARRLASLSSQDVQAVMTRYVEIAEVMALKYQDIQATVKMNIEELIRVDSPVSSVSKAA